MKAPFAPAVWLVSGFLLLPWCASPASSAAGTKTQHGRLLLNGKRADVSLTKDREQLSVTISAKSNKGHPLDWSRVKASVYCSPPGRGDLGDFRFDMPLTRTNTRSGKRASALFVFKAEPSVIDQVAGVRVEACSNACSLDLPLSREEVLARFRARGSAEELRQFEELRLSKDRLDQERALELVLSKLTEGELDEIGIHVWGAEYCVASGSYNEETCNAISEELRLAKIHARCDRDGGGVEWWVRSPQFLRARRALLQAKDPRLRAYAAVPQPEFYVEWCVWSGSYDEATCNAIQEELRRVQIAASSLGNCGCLNFYVTKEQFFRAGRALLQAKDRRVRAGALWPPRFSLR
jgi:hypothetical protein